MSPPAPKPPTVYTAGMTLQTDQGFFDWLFDPVKRTIGGFAAKDDKSGRPMLISCSQGIFPGFDASPGSRIYSPNYSSSCCGGEMIAKPIYNKNKPAVKDRQGWMGGYREGKWYGGFDSQEAYIWQAGGNVLSDASGVNCAAAELLDGVHYRNVWQINQEGQPPQEIELGLPFVNNGLGYGVGKGPDWGVAPTKDQYVRFYSAATKRLQYGTMLSNTMTSQHHLNDPDDLLRQKAIPFNGSGERTLVNQFIILPRPTPPQPAGAFAQNDYKASYRGSEPLSIDADAVGTFVINSNRDIIAMLVGRFPSETFFPDKAHRTELVDVAHLGIATPIDTVLTWLGATIPVAGYSGVAPAAEPGRFLVPGFGPGSRMDAATQARRTTVLRLRDQLGTSVRGRLLLGLVGRHRVEAHRLLRGVAPVAAAWRALGGPAYYHHCLRSVERSGHRIPMNINGVSRERLFDGLLSLLHEHGSDTLRRDLDRYGVLLREDLLDIESIMDVPDALARPSPTSQAGPGWTPPPHAPAPKARAEGVAT